MMPRRDVGERSINHHRSAMTTPPRSVWRLTEFEVCRAGETRAARSATLDQVHRPGASRDIGERKRHRGCAGTRVRAHDIYICADSRRWRFGGG
jgi:hypothetical protein